MQVLSRRLRQTICQGLEQHRRVAIAFRLIFLPEIFRPGAARHGKSAHIVRPSLTTRHHIVDQRFIDSILTLSLLTKHRETRTTNQQVIALTIRLEQAISRPAIFRLQGHEVVEHLDSVLVKLHRLRRFRAFRLRHIGQPSSPTSVASMDSCNRLITPVQLPGQEKEAPMDIRNDRLNRNIRYQVNTHLGRDNRLISRPIDRHRMSACLFERD